MAKFLIYLRASRDEPETTGEETTVVNEEDSIKTHNKENANAKLFEQRGR